MNYLKFQRIYFKIFIVLIISAFMQACFEKDRASVKTSNSINDSITNWIKASRNQSYAAKERRNYLAKAYESNLSLKLDSLHVRNLSAISYQCLALRDTLLFKKYNEATLSIAKKVKDTFTMGDAHWNFASYYNDKQVYDSAYFHFNKAYSFFNKIGYVSESSNTLFGMAFIKGRFKDYAGSEALTFKAIQKFKKNEDYKFLFTCYNHLGQLQKDINEFDRALFYYEKASSYIKMIEDEDALNEVILNNTANIYIKKKEYSKALEYYNKILISNDFKKQSIVRYAKIIDNIAYCRFLMRDTVNVEAQLREALNIRDSLNNKEGIVLSKIRLARYYAFKKDTISAFRFANEANSLAKDIKNSRDYMESLYLLSTLNKKQSSEYLKKHIHFNDSLQIVERKTQNKFARIDFETDEFIEETKRLSQQKIFILVMGSALILIIGLLYFLSIQKSRTEKLRLENEQQRVQEQVYLLTLKEQEKLEREKINERNRIAEELHDGILGKLFGIRVGLGFLDIVANENIKEKHQFYLEELQTIEKEIREVSHKLSDNFDNPQVGFLDIISQLLEFKSKIGKFDYSLEVDENINWWSISEKIKENLNRVLLEALQNIIKYAFAKKVEINFFLKNEHLVLVLKDDGVGFDVNKKEKGIGLKNMKSRIKKLKGEFNLYSKLNEGTTIKIQIPI
ncbi:tetratricopeptide repeat-containing sensor histidine kinase [Flavobacterium sp. HNIBRBA15423]|uniref:tetratricopeptide repeat-containing sensor histidine kinase n=1 Tax=Flavobacterium sp. HNIBRBA15423 TaxID=3458683 RepID=UPI004043FD20